MGTIIKATSIIIGNGHDSSVDLSAKVIEECIEKTQVVKKDIGLLLNVGIHRDQNIVEPAIASLIQKKAHLNLNPTTRQLGLGKGTFSFDVLNGSCGFLSAIQVADAFFKSGQADKAIIVSSDVHPSGHQVPEFPFVHSGAAMLLERSDEKNGFGQIFHETSENGSAGIQQYLHTKDHGSNGRNLITIDVEENYFIRLKEFILKTVNKYYEKGFIDLKEVDHIITTTQSKEFGREIVNSLGFKKNTLVEVYDKYGDTNTSSLIIGYHLAQEEGELKPGDKVLFIGGSSGLTCAFGMYEV